MSKQFTTLIHQHEDSIIHAWVDEMYGERRTELPAMLSYGQLVDHLSDLLAELATALDLAATESEISEAARRLRSHPQIRFHQGALIDEVARELMIFRKVFSDFLWRDRKSVV